ncbi:MAG: hypothetical protein K0S34_786 [Bacillales bacterium]|jgi:GH24 family phage-related lysozyme (muramidase)|nr:hypothetical protein [Bacillales bacterium]
MLISKNGLDLIKKFEGCRLQAYLDPVGVPTIGYGHTSRVKLGQTITQAQADELLKDDIKIYSNHVQALIDNKTILFKVNQNMFDALTSFCYNLGKGNLIKLVKGRVISEVSSAMLLYVKAGGRVLNGLVRRRTEERNLFLKPVENAVNNSFRVYTVVKGDTLTKISKKLKRTIDTLSKMNNIKDINKIYVGQIIKY